MTTPAISRRAAALRRSHVRTYVLFMLGDETSSYDVDSLVLELVDMDDSDYQSMGIEQFWTIANRHEYDERGVTDAALAKAIEISTNGWFVTVTRPDGEIQTLTLKKVSASDTAETVEARLREFVQFPEGTSMMILPLVG